MSEPSVETVVSVYAATRDQLIEQVTTLVDLDQVEAMVVPSCPEWSVKDVLAHLSGLVADVLAGVEGSLGTDENTTRQVNTRSTMSVIEVCSEWSGNAAAIEPVFGAEPLRGWGLTADLAVHVHDLAEMLDGVSPPPVEATRLGCGRYVPLLQERAAEQLDLGLAVKLDRDRIWAANGGSSRLVMSGSYVDFLRSVTGRRTRSQAEAAFRWEGEPTTLLDQVFTQYGPFRPER